MWWLFKKKKNKINPEKNMKKNVYCYVCNKLCHTSNLYLVNNILMGICSKCYIELISFKL